MLSRFGARTRAAAAISRDSDFSETWHIFFYIARVLGNQSLEFQSMLMMKNKFATKKTKFHRFSRDFWNDLPRTFLSRWYSTLPESAHKFPISILTFHDRFSWQRQHSVGNCNGSIVRNWEVRILVDSLLETTSAPKPKAHENHW